MGFYLLRQCKVQDLQTIENTQDEAEQICEEIRQYIDGSAADLELEVFGKAPFQCAGRRIGFFEEDQAADAKFASDVAGADIGRNLAGTGTSDG